MTSSPDHASASPDTVNADDPDLAAQVQTQAIREQLIRRINAYTHPKSPDPIELRLPTRVASPRHAHWRG